MIDKSSILLYNCTTIHNTERTLMKTIIEETVLDVKQTPETTEVIINGREIFLNTNYETNDSIVELLRELGFKINVER